MHILIINGPNLNLLGKREPSIYGSKTYPDLEKALNDAALSLNITVEIHQTNLEGIIIDLLHYAEHKNFQGVILNAAAYSHYSYAIYDAIKAIDIPVVNVHLTDPTKRSEAFRALDVIEPAALKTFKGNGFKSYLDALSYLTKDVIK